MVALSNRAATGRATRGPSNQWPLCRGFCGLVYVDRYTAVVDVQRQRLSDLDGRYADFGVDHHDAHRSSEEDKIGFQFGDRAGQEHVGR